MSGRARWLALVALTALLLALAGLWSAAAVGERVVVYGADLTAAERQELAATFGEDAGATVETVTTADLVAALQGTGLPVAPADRSVSSTALTCAGPGVGLTIRTRNITRIPAAAYAGALLTAGAGDTAVLLAAPAGNPVSGETALVGALRAAARCPGAAAGDPARARLAYEQVARTVALAGPGGEMAAAAGMLLEAAQPAVTGAARDDAALGAALDRAAAGRGLAVDPEQRAATVAFLRRLGDLDHGAYARGYRLEQVGPDEVRLSPAVAQATPTAPAPASPAPAAPPPPPEATAQPRPASGIGDASAASLRAALVAYVPRLAGALALLALGGVAAALAARGAARRLAAAGVSPAGGLLAALRAGLLFVLGVLAAAVLGVDVTLLVALVVIALGALALAAALALGLGLRELSRNIAGGRYVREGLAEGDRIVAGGVAGTVERIGVAMTTVRGADGRAYLVPNAYFLEHVVAKEGAAAPGESHEDGGTAPS